MTIARMVAAAPAAALVLLLAPVAPASIYPVPPQPQPQPQAQKTASHGLVLTGSRRQHVTARSCSAHAKAAWWFSPVACEQPPKSQLLVPLLGG